MRTRATLAIATLSIALIAAACGSDSPSTNASDDSTRTVNVQMVDIAFKPTTLQVRRGETIKFAFTNDGKVAHDAFIGDKDAQADHEKDMSSDMGDMHHGDDAEDAITVDPGDTGELTHTFDEGGTFEIGCHQPGHYAGGMKIVVTVN